MKNFILTFALFYSALGFSQVAIGKNSVTNNSVSLEFYDSADNKRGLIVPWVSSIPSNPIAYNSSNASGYQGMQGTIADGTIIFDLSDKKVKYRKAGDWFDLTGNLPFPLTLKNASNADVKFTQFNNINSNLQDSVKEQSNAKVVIGANGNTDTTTGVLVLSDKNKAMVLPKVANPHLNIINPSAGMIVYDTANKFLAVYNGTIWSFWKPE